MFREFVVVSVPSRLRVMLNFFKFVVASLVSALFMVPLLWESWFSWRLLVTLSLFCGVLYWLFCAAQYNMLLLFRHLADRLSSRK